jgi:putative oxidoreductase
MKLGHHILRIIVGVLFMGHGAQKLFGKFGGGGLEGTGQMFESLGLRPGRRNAAAAGAAELGGGALVASGALMPLGAAALSGTMITAIRHVHFAKGPWASQGGYEYNLVILAALFALTNEHDGPFWACAQLVAGAAGAVAATEMGRRHEPAPPSGAVPAPTPSQPADARETVGVAS